PFAVKRRAAGGAADEKALGPHVLRGPDEVADPLETEHRIEDVKRNHVDSVCAVSRASGVEARHRAGLSDAFFENLAADGFFVFGDLLGIDRLVKLAHVRVN